MPRDILVIGGRGKTGRRVAQKLAQMGVPRRIATRSPEAADEVAFDWMRPDLAPAAFKDAQAVYIVAPTDSVDHGVIVPPVLELALMQGVQRFVLLSASMLEMGDPMMGEVHAWLATNAPEWTVLRPSWFMQNFSEQQHLGTVVEDSLIYSATGDGKVGFIDAEDIASAAVAALTSEIAWNRDFILTGPEALSYDDVAAHLSKALKRNVRHRQLSHEELVRRLRHSGMDGGYANVLADMDRRIAGSAENRVTDGVWQLAGSQPISFGDFIQREIASWPILQ